MLPGGGRRQEKTCTLHSTTYPLPPTSFTLIFATHTLHPTLYTLHRTPYTLHFHFTPHTLHPAPCTSHLTPHTPHPSPCILHPPPYTLHPTPCATLFKGSPPLVSYPPCSPLGPLGFEGAQHRQTLRPSVDGIRSKALRPFGLQ